MIASLKRRLIFVAQVPSRDIPFASRVRWVTFLTKAGVR